MLETDLGQNIILITGILALFGGSLLTAKIGTTLWAGALKLAGVEAVVTTGKVGLLKGGLGTLAGSLASVAAVGIGGFAAGWGIGRWLADLLKFDEALGRTLTKLDVFGAEKRRKEGMASEVASAALQAQRIRNFAAAGKTEQAKAMDLDRFNSGRGSVLNSVDRSQTSSTNHIQNTITVNDPETAIQIFEFISGKPQ